MNNTKTKNLQIVSTDEMLLNSLTSSLMTLNPNAQQELEFMFAQQIFTKNVIKKLIFFLSENFKLQINEHLIPVCHYIIKEALIALKQWRMRNKDFSESDVLLYQFIIFLEEKTIKHFSYQIEFKNELWDLESGIKNRNYLFQKLVLCTSQLNLENYKIQDLDSFEFNFFSMLLPSSLFHLIYNNPNEPMLEHNTISELIKINNEDLEKNLNTPIFTIEK